MNVVRNLLLGLIFVAFAATAGRAQTTPAQAFDNVVIHKADGKIIEDGAIVWRYGIIESVGKDIRIPFDAYTIDGGDSLHIYPGFVDGMALWGSPDLPKNYERPERPGDPGYQRAGVQPQRRPADLLNNDDNDLEEAQRLGFTTAALGLKGQMLPGNIDLFFINGKDTGKHLLKSGAALLAGFEHAPGSFGNGAYPATTMGVMAEYRQLWYDATALMQQEAYFASTSSNYPAPKKNEVLEALYPVITKSKPLFFVADSKENIERLFNLMDKLDFKAVLVSGKEAYKKADELKQRNIPVLASIDLPDKPKWKVKEEKAAKDTSMTKEAPETVTEEIRSFRERQLQEYKAEIENVAKLIKAGVTVGYASNGMKLSDFNKHLKTLSEDSGLTEKELLALLTQNTANILGIGSRAGDLAKGKIASFSVFNAAFLHEKAKAGYSVSAGEITEFESQSSKN